MRQAKHTRLATDRWTAADAGTPRARGRGPGRDQAAGSAAGSGRVDAGERSRWPG